MKKTLQKSNPKNFQNKSLVGRIPVSGHFLQRPPKRACRRTKLSFFEIVRLLKGTSAEDRPEWLVLENVKNLLYVNKGWDFETVLRSLAKSAIISSTDCLIQSSTAYRKTENGSTLSLTDILEPNADEKYFLSKAATEKLLYSFSEDVREKESTTFKA